jgi:glycosyltransferase involved in cell wall biosynthesis
MTVSVAQIEEMAAPVSSHSERKRVLVCAASYLPGYKSGGPIRSIANMVAHLSSQFDFYVVTRDRDATDTESYPGVTPNKWYRVGNARVLYCSSVGPGILLRAAREVRPDIISLNSFQDVFTRIMVLLRRGGALGDTPMLLAARGEFSPGAMEIKRNKKAIYRHSTKLLGFHENLLWQVSTARERSELLAAAPARRLDPDSVYVACNISDIVVSAAPHVAKESGSAKLAFITRISEKKNLHFLLELLKELRGQVQLNLFGPVAETDSAYWGRCRALLAQLPANIMVEYHGSLDHSAVPQVLHDHHFFVLPTRGENFCHAAVESFVNGTPVILSDETPWVNLNEVRAGFDISLDDRERWIAVLQECVDMDPQAYAAYLSGARGYGRRFSVEEAVSQHLAMFDAALNVRPRAERVSVNVP